VLVVRATNRRDVLDSALTRPGRLDRSLIVYPPDGEGRKDIIQHYLNQKAHDETCDVAMMAQDSVGWTPIHIKTIINEALIVANEDGRDKLTYKDWLNAADMRFFGLKQPITKMSADVRGSPRDGLDFARCTRKRSRRFPRACSGARGQDAERTVRGNEAAHS